MIFLFLSAKMSKHFSSIVRDLEYIQANFYNWEVIAQSFSLFLETSLGCNSSVMDHMTSALFLGLRVS